MVMMDRVNETLSALEASGIPAMRGFPEGCLPQLTQPTAAVTVESADQRQTVLAVTLYGPKGRKCEQVALLAADVLRSKRASCHVGACSFDAKSDLFSVEVRAVWMEYLRSTLKINELPLVYATEFSAVQTRQVDKTQTGVTAGEAVWTVAIQELLPFREAILEDTKEGFTLKVFHENCTEIYPQCHWLSITLEEGDGGLLRKRIARSWEERVIEPKA